MKYFYDLKTHNCALCVFYSYMLNNGEDTEGLHAECNIDEYNKVIVSDSNIFGDIPENCPLKNGKIEVSFKQH